jgi:hypothetical protein
LSPMAMLPPGGLLSLRVILPIFRSEI